MVHIKIKNISKQTIKILHTAFKGLDSVLNDFLYYKEFRPINTQKVVGGM